MVYNNIEKAMLFLLPINVAHALVIGELLRLHYADSWLRTVGVYLFSSCPPPNTVGM